MANLLGKLIETPGFVAYVKRKWYPSLETSRERPKSAPYLRLNKTRKPLFYNWRQVSGKSHSAEKRKMGDPLNIHSVAKYQKIDEGTLWSNKKIRKKLGNLNSLAVPKKGESLIVTKKVERGTLLLWNGFFISG